MNVHIRTDYRGCVDFIIYGETEAIYCLQPVIQQQGQVLWINLEPDIKCIQSRRF